MTPRSTGSTLLPDPPAAATLRSVPLHEEMRNSYLDYAMSVIVSRALPDVRDGLKPVQRRILYAMHAEGLTPGGKHRKSAAIVGEVMKSYHPHGDAAIYDTMVRLAQNWVMRYPLVDGQGNFGSVDGDAPAAPRYTEARMTTLGHGLLADIEKETVAWGPNYSNETEEPLVLPAPLPNLLINGASGIAVGMATNLPPHNLCEVVDALLLLISRPDASAEQLIRIVTGPDFPTGGIVMIPDLLNLYSSGHGRMTVRARVEMEEGRGGRDQLVVTELPYQANKSRLIAEIAELVSSKRVEGIADLRDESDREHAVRIVIEMKRDADARQVLAALFKLSGLETTYGAMMLALVDGRPQVLSLKEMLEHHLGHHREVVSNRTRFLLRKAEARAHIVAGLLRALDALDEVIQIIRTAADEDAARHGLEQRLGIDEVQSKAIVDLRLGRLTRLEASQLRDEAAKLSATIADLRAVLADSRKVDAIVADELRDLKKRYGDARRSEIRHGQEAAAAPAVLPVDEDGAVLVSAAGMVARVSLHRARAVRAELGTDPVVSQVVAAATDELLLFTRDGQVCRRRARDIGAQPQLPGSNGELAATAPCVGVVSSEGTGYVLLATEHGQAQRCEQSVFRAIRPGGTAAMKLATGDRVALCATTDGQRELLLVSSAGRAVRFREDLLRPTGRGTQGVGGIALGAHARVVGACIVDPAGELLIVTTTGFAKRVRTSDFPTQGRNGQGVQVVSSNAGDVAAAIPLPSGTEAIWLQTSAGRSLTVPASTAPEQGRATRGSKVLDLGAGETVVAAGAPAGS